MEENQNQQPINPTPQVSNQLANATSTPSQSVIPNPDPESNSSNPRAPVSKFSLKMIIVTMIFLLLAGGAAASFTVLKPQILRLASKPSPTVILGSTRNPSPIPTDYKTYTNDLFGFSFQYPKDGIIDATYNPENIAVLNLTVSIPSKYYVKSYQNIKVGTSINVNKNSSPCLGPIEADLTNIEITTIKKGVKESVLLEGTGKKYPFYQKSICLYNSGYSYWIYTELSNKSSFNKEIIDANSNLYHQILSSFEFTESTPNPSTYIPSPTPTPTSTPSLNLKAEWKTYTNQKYTISVNYPASLTLNEIDETTNPYNPYNTIAMFQENHLTSTEEECVNIHLNIQTFNNSEDLGIWLKRKYPFKGWAGPPNETPPPSEIYPYTNSVDTNINGYWMVTGAETRGKEIFIKKGNYLVSLHSPGCSAGDNFKYHPKTMDIMEKMIPTFKITN